MNNRQLPFNFVYRSVVAVLVIFITSCSGEGGKVNQTSTSMAPLPAPEEGYANVSGSVSLPKNRPVLKFTHESGGFAKLGLEATDKSYQINLPAGKYVISASSKDESKTISCVPHQIELPSKQSIVVNVECAETKP